MIRPFRAETERYGHYSVAGEFVYDHPFQWGSKRTGPDLQRVGGRYTDEWHRMHLMNIRATWCRSRTCRPIRGSRHSAADARRHRGQDARAAHASACRTPTRRSPGAAEELKGKTEMDALIAYLQGLGTALKGVR